MNAASPISLLKAHPIRPNDTAIALLISVINSSSRCPIFSFNLCLSIVRICSRRTTESLVSPTLSAYRSICVGSFDFAIFDVIAAAITSRMSKTHLPTHIDIFAEKAGLAKDSVVLLEQIRTLDKKRLKEKMGHLDDDVMSVVNSAIAVSFGLDNGTSVSGEADGSVTAM